MVEGYEAKWCSPPQSRALKELLLHDREGQGDELQMKDTND